MKACNNCQQASEAPGWAWHSLQCLWCGARLIQAIGRLPIPVSQVSQRRRAVLNDWVAWGHNEKTIRALVEEKALPLGPEKVKESEAPNPTKRR